jgi:hypothetical protein
MAEMDGEGERKKILLGGTRWPLVIALVVVGVIGGAYYMYYRQQVAYYTGRNARVLAMLTDQIEGRISVLAGVSDDNDCIATNAEVQRDIEQSARGLRIVLRRAPCQPKSVLLSDIVRPIAARSVSAAFDVLLIASADGKVIYSMRPPPRQSTLLEAQEEWIDDEDEAAPVGEKPAGEDAGATVTASTTPPSAATTNAATPSTATSTAPPNPATTKAAETKAASKESTTATRAAAEERESESVVQINRLDALLQKKTWRVYDKLDLPPLTSATGHVNVTLDGSDYVLFTQPYTFARARASEPQLNLPAQQSSQWIVCGLVSSSRFRYEVSAVSTSIILFAVAFMLLAICCWPFLRIALIDPSQAMTIADVVLVVLCTIVGVAVLTLMLLDYFAYRRLTETVDSQIARFSRTVDRDFGSNVARAAAVLKAAENITRPKAIEAAAGANLWDKFGTEITTNDDIAKYPYVDSIAWIDENGQQRLRLGRVKRPVNNVGDRKYFQQALKERMESVDGVDYVLEWVRSKANGEVRALMAKRADKLKETVDGKSLDKDPPFPVVAIGTELIDISHAVRPPGVGLAIIDENGEVLYHSDPERIGYENFFAEADRNRDLRSAVLARRSGLVTASYWGEDESMFVRPLSGSHWTLIAFRPKRLTRVLNVEGALLALVLLLFNSAPYLLICVVVMLVAPSYRAPNLWPDATRFDDYLRLCLILPGILLLFALNNYTMAPWSLFWGVVIIPALSIVTTYLVLHRSGSERKFRIALAVWIAVNGLLIAHFVPPTAFDSEAGLNGEPARIASIVVALVVMAMTVILLTRSDFGPQAAAFAARIRARFGYAGLYRICGVLLLIIGVVMPVVGFFGISRFVETQLLVKYAQLRAAADLEHRIDHLETLSSIIQTEANKGDVQRDVLTNKLLDVFNGDWRLIPPLPTRDLALVKAWPNSIDDRDAQTIPTWAATWLPSLYEDSIAIRPLFENGSADGLWRWNVKGSLIELTRHIRFDKDVARWLWPEEKKDKQIISIRSSSAPDPAPPAGALGHSAAVAILGGALLALFWYVVGFIAKRVVLIDVTEPDWLLHRPLSPSLGDHIFFVRRHRPISALISPAGKGLPFLDVSFEKLDCENAWSDTLEKLDSSEPGRNVRITDFEYKINDVAMNKKKLAWLERLMSLPDRTVVIVSTVTIAYVMTTPAPMFTEGYFDRWRKLLNRFVGVTAEELELRNDEYVRRKRFPTVSQFLRRGPQSWLEKETEYNSFLRTLRDELLHSSSDPSHLLDEIGDRAETYYAGLWESCREEEKLLLYQLAHTGLANARNRRVLRRLIARGLVRRDPNLSLFSETFRLYVLAAARRENVVSRAREQRPASTWDSLRVPFFVVIISFLLLLFATQKDLMTTTTALATALTTGLPMAMKLLGVFTDRRVGAAERT